MLNTKFHFKFNSIWVEVAFYSLPDGSFIRIEQDRSGYDIVINLKQKLVRLAAMELNVIAYQDKLSFRYI